MTQKLLFLFVTDEMIYAHYFDNYSLRGKFHSPFRYDPRPSLSFKNVGTYKSPRVIWKDFGLSNARADSIGFVMQMYGLTVNQAVHKIWKELVMDEEVRLERPKVKIPINIPYDFITSDFESEKEYNYWLDLFWTKKLLSFFNVSKLKYMMKGDKVIWEWADSMPIYHYDFIDESEKVYKPLDPKGDKFRGQNNSDTLEGYEQLPRNGDVLFIDSSLKDTGCMRVIGAIALNPTSENSYHSLLKKRRELNTRFKKIYILFDNDSAGINSANFLSQLTGWEPIHLPQRMSKDQSDFVNKYGNYFGLLKFLPNFKKNNYGEFN